jgi:DNA replication and repair protein RecF
VRRVHLLKIRTTGFRNLVPRRVAFAPAINLVVGGNGEGKTNLLEAITVLGNLRSFRASSVRQVVTHGLGEFVLDGRLATATGPVRLRQHVQVGPPVRRTLEVGGTPASVAEYLQVAPVIALSGDDRELVVGPPAIRRALLDRFVFLLEPGYYNELRAYRRLLRQRNAALVAGSGDREIEVWEEQLARAAAVVVGRRRAACRRLAASFKPVYEELHGGNFPDISVNYRGETTIDASHGDPEVEEHYRKRYNETRVRDRQTGFTGEGPHRHDVDLRANGKAVRHMLSAGQTKVAAAALRLASLHDVEERRGERLPVILDDVDAELDPRVLSRLIGHLGSDRQLLLSSAAAGVFTELDESSMRLAVTAGAVAGHAGERVHE